MADALSEVQEEFLLLELERSFKHYGPGNQPSGTPQSVRGHGDRSGVRGSRQGRTGGSRGPGVGEAQTATGSPAPRPPMFSSPTQPQATFAQPKKGRGSDTPGHEEGFLWDLPREGRSNDASVNARVVIETKESVRAWAERLPEPFLTANIGRGSVVEAEMSGMGFVAASEEGAWTYIPARKR